MLYRQKGTGRGEGREGGREGSLLMQRIHFVFPQTADTIFNLIRFQDTTCLRTLLVASPFLSSVSRGVNHELVAYVFFVVATEQMCLLHICSPPGGYHLWVLWLLFLNINSASNIELALWPAPHYFNSLICKLKYIVLTILICKILLLFFFLQMLFLV